METAKKELIELDLKAKKERYSNVPSHALPKIKVTADANGLTQAIVSWLNLNGHFATRVSSSGRYLPQLGKFIPSTTKRGTADIHSVIGGRHVSIEVKIGKDRMSEAQHEMKAKIEKAGGLYFVATDFEQFMKWYKTLNEKI